MVSFRAVLLLGTLVLLVVATSLAVYGGSMIPGGTSPHMMDRLSAAHGCSKLINCLDPPSMSATKVYDYGCGTFDFDR
jgi:hypothetical protein